LAEREPSAMAQRHAGVTWTWSEFDRRADGVAAALLAAGVVEQDKVAQYLYNGPEYLESAFAAFKAGLAIVNTNFRYAHDELVYLWDNADVVAVVFHGTFADRVQEIRDRVPRIRLWLWVDDGSGPCPEWATPYEAAATAAAPAHVRGPWGRSGDHLVLLYTGGTTGLPKGVMLTSRNLETMTALTLMGYPFSGRPAYLALAPLTHAAGVLCFPVMALGGRIVVMPKPDVGEFIALIERERITHTFLPPTLIYMLLGHEALSTTDLSSLQCFWYGAAPMSTARLEEALARIGPMAQLFGQTEAPMMVSMLPPAEHYNADGTVATKRLASAGRPAPLVTVGIMDPEGGELLPAGERGEIVVRGSLVMAGYYKNPEATEAASKHGWHHTGDIGYLDEDGYLFIVDRLKDMIITGGFNVYSAEVEQALMQHPAVRDCAVVGLPDDKWGERVTAVIEPSADVQPDELVAFVKARIGSVKAPKQVELWQELPRSRVGKVLKADVRNQLLNDQD
jgi:acyl-CoA synthetase (AMP-forming)/AMP-acid ligase II